ncbi:hypothetical protein [Sphingomonas sp. 28-63-12]|uniref:hypothetical protein n=1 Tax=Sphingomonas sp. 28-63-12 TaxID=1970434 RepID=UPI000BD0B47F|nr:MAG: hypothetical protein B7Y47_14435 [Sphingomonas sp. 28-63-12]
MIVNLHIERLVLEGLPVRAKDTTVLAAAVDAALRRLLAEPGTAAALNAGASTAVRAGEPITLTTASDPAAIGDLIGRAIFGGIGA